MIKGLDKLIKQLAVDDCPCDWGLENVNETKDLLGCKYSDGGPMCNDCWNKALEKKYEEKQ